ncbi:Vacuolar protein sorting-associated protein 20 2 [Glycine soja]|uniref:Vacuolar protein sorting-associated protein 20-like 2 isoform B n=1 Tax=Glycine soja TaxID=3848 RepID=A0A445L362_GLYSO|nr:Vacuolar protein sorting-associated protein 20-like 2 isoform B [Glycine soja]
MCQFSHFPFWCLVLMFRGDYCALTFLSFNSIIHQKQIHTHFQLADIELASKQKAVFESLKAGNDAMKAIQSEINIEDVQKLMDDTAEAKAYQDEINEIMGEKLSAEDEEEILAEFEDLEIQLTVQDLPEVPPSVHEEIEEKLDLPDVPTKAPVTSDAEVSTKGKVMEEPLAA